MSLRASASQITAPHFLLRQFENSNWFNRFFKGFEARLLNTSADAEAHLENLANPSIKALLTAALFEQLERPLVVICPDPQTAVKYEFELNQFLRGHIERYPAEDFSPYDLAVFPVQALKNQYRILNRLQEKQPFILLVSAKNLLLKHLSLEEQDHYALKLQQGQIIGPETVVEQCLALGYVRTSMIMDAGEFSSRGDIFDLYPVNGDPVRIEFFGDTIENIRLIDVENQRSIERVKETWPYPL